MNQKRNLLTLLFLSITFMCYSCTKTVGMPPDSLAFAKTKVDEYTKSIQTFDTAIQALRIKAKSYDELKEINQIDKTFVQYVNEVEKYTDKVIEWEKSGNRPEDLDTLILQIEFLRKNLREQLIINTAS